MDIKKMIAAAVASSMMITSVVSFASNVSAYRLPAKYTDVSIKLSGLTEEHLKRVPLSMILDNMTYASDVYADETSEPAASDDETSEPAASDDETSEPAASDDETSEPAASDDETSEPAASDDETSEPAASDDETSEPAASDDETSEPAASDNETSEPAASDDETSEPTASDNETSEPAASDDETSEPATSDDETSEPATLDNETSKPVTSDDETEYAEVNNEQQNVGEVVVDVTAGDPIETETAHGLVHRKDDKVEFSADAAYIRIDDTVYSLSDENAAVDLFVADSPDEYVLVKEIIVSSDESFDSEDECFIASFFITKNFWSFDEFRFYTENENEEKIYLKTKPGKELDNSIAFTVFSPLERGKNVYLEADPRLVWNDTVRGDVDIEVTYHGTSVKAENILSNGKIMLDLRAFDEDGALVTEQYGITVSIAEEAFLISGNIASGDAFADVESTISMSEGRSGLPDAAKFAVSFDIASLSSEFVLTVDKLALLRSGKELGEEDLLGAYIGCFGSLDEIPGETASIAAELFGDGINAVDGTEITLFADPAFVPELVTVDADAFVINITININVTEPVPTEPDTSEPATSEPVTSEPTTFEPVTSEPTTSEPVTSEPATSEPVTSEPATSEPVTSEPATSEPVTSEPATSEPVTSEPATSEPVTSEPTTSEPVTSEPATSEPVTSEPATSEPVTSEPATSEPEDPKPASEVKLWSGFGEIYNICFDNLRNNYRELLVAYSGELSDLEVTLINAGNISLGDIEVISGEAANELLAGFEAFEAVEPAELSSEALEEPVENKEYGVIKIRIDPVKDGYGRLFNGVVSGMLSITAANAEPLEIMLDGSVDVLKITRRVDGVTPVKYIPYSAGFMLEGNVDYVSAEFSAVGLPDGLSINKKTGVISGIPESSGGFVSEISAEVTFFDENGELQSAVISREASFDVSVNSARNLHMNSDPNYEIYEFLGDSFDGRTYYIDGSDVAESQEIVLKGDVAEFVDLWINGEKIRRISDDYKTKHGTTSIKFSENALSRYEKDEIHTMVFGFKSAENDRMIYAAQNFSIVDDKASVPVTAVVPEDYKDVYTPANRLDEALDRELADVLSSVKVYTEQNAFKDGNRLVVKPYSAAFDYPAMTIRIVDENGAPVETDLPMTVGIALPESYEESFYLYEITNGVFEPISYIDIKDGRLFFALDTTKSYAVSKTLLNGLGEPEGSSDTVVSGVSVIRSFSDENPVTGIAVSGAGIVISGTALALIFFTGRRRKGNTDTK